MLLPKRILTRENVPPFRTFELPVSVPTLQFARPAPLSTRPRLVGRKATARPVVETKPPSWNFGWTAVAPRPCSVEPEPISEMLRPVVESRSHHSLRYRSEYAGRERETLFRHAPRTSPACRSTSSPASPTGFRMGSVTRGSMPPTSSSASGARRPSTESSGIPGQASRSHLAGPTSLDRSSPLREASTSASAISTPLLSLLF